MYSQSQHAEQLIAGARVGAPDPNSIFDFPEDQQTGPSAPCVACPKVLGASFGDADVLRTFSGVAGHLFRALADVGRLAGRVRTDLYGGWDFFARPILPRLRSLRGLRGAIRTQWLWRRNTIDLLSRRFDASIQNGNRSTVILQIGTHVLSPKDIPMYIFTDATVLQCAAAGEFHLSGWPVRRIQEAIETQRLIFASARCVFVPSRWAQNSVVRDYGIPRERVPVVGEGILLPTARLPMSPSADPTIVFIGRRWELKGGPLLIDALARVRRAIPNAKLVIIGCRPRLTLEGVVELGLLHKGVPQDWSRFEQTMSSSWVLCVPSRFDAYGLCFLEAQAYGVVPVTFAGEGREDTISDGVTGVLVRERTAAALADALIGLLQNSEKRAEMSRAGRARVPQSFTWPLVARRILRYICKELAGRDLHVTTPTTAHNEQPQAGR